MEYTLKGHIFSCTHTLVYAYKMKYTGIYCLQDATLSKASSKIIMMLSVINVINAIVTSSDIHFSVICIVYCGMVFFLLLFLSVSPASLAPPTLSTVAAEREAV